MRWALFFLWKWGVHSNPRLPKTSAPKKEIITITTFPVVIQGNDLNNKKGVIEAGQKKGRRVVDKDLTLCSMEGRKGISPTCENRLQYRGHSQSKKGRRALLICRFILPAIWPKEGRGGSPTLLGS